MDTNKLLEPFLVIEERYTQRIHEVLRLIDELDDRNKDENYPQVIPHDFDDYAIGEIAHAYPSLLSDIRHADMLTGIKSRSYNREKEELQKYLTDLVDKDNELSTIIAIYHA